MIAEANLAQTKADALRAMEKHRDNEDINDFPVPRRTISDFMGYCNITQPPHIQGGLFT